MSQNDMMSENIRATKYAMLTALERAKNSLPLYELCRLVHKPSDILIRALKELREEKHIKTFMQRDTITVSLLQDADRE